MLPEEKAPGPHSAQTRWKLCIMRHGAAVTRETEGYSDDSKRPLTPDGKRKMQGIAKGLRRLGFVADWIVSSPLVRAVETAEIVAESVGSDVALDFSNALSPGGSPEALLGFLGKHADRKRVLAGRRANLAFKKGGCCLIRFDEFPPRSPGRLLWWLTPRALRKMA